MDGGLTAAILLSPPLHLRTNRFFVQTMGSTSADPRASFEIQPGLREFLNDTKLSAGITEEESGFLKSLHFNGKRPSPLYYYRELQNLRDPLNFFPAQAEKGGRSQAGD